MILHRKKPLFLNDFKNDTAEGVYGAFHNYGTNSILPENIKILFADYTYEYYSGDAYVIGYDKDRKQYFEVHGSHCSCYDLEDQWEPDYCASQEQLIDMISKRQQYPYCRAASSDELRQWVGLND